MTVKTETKETLRNNASTTEIRGKFRSKSQLYEALTEFLKESEDRVEKTHAALQGGQLELQKTDAQHERLEIEKRVLVRCRVIA